MIVHPPVPRPTSTQPLDAGAYGPVGRSPWLDIDWHEHQQWLTVDGQAINTISLGPEAGADPGQPIVFVHGLAGSWPNWLEQLPVLAARHRVIALDLPGFGHSPMPAEEISISGYAHLLDRVLEQLEIGAAAVVGNSMGGFITTELAIAFPQRVERLVLVSAAGLSTYEQPGGTHALAAMRAIERLLTATTAWVASKSDAVALYPRLRNATLGAIMRHPSRLPAPLAAEQLRGSGKPGFIQALQAIWNYDIRERLPEIACPTLIVWGASDRVITVRDADLFEQLIPNSRKVVFSDTGHAAMLERPAAFNRLLEDFLDE